MRTAPFAALAALALTTLAWSAGVSLATHGLLVPVMHAAAQDHPEALRPGVWLTEPHDCTMAFLLRDAAGTLYGTTAGHCVDAVGQPVAAKGFGEVGVVVAFRDARLDGDFALFRLHEAAALRANASMAGWNGPTGRVDGPETGVVTVRHYGYGAATWMTPATRCRTAVAVADTWTAETFNQDGVLAWGDSGSPSMTADGRALGINTHLAAPPRPGTSFGTRLDYAMSELEAMTGLTLTLETGEPPRDACGE